MVDEPGLFKTSTRHNSISIETDDQFCTLRAANNSIQSRISRQYPHRLLLKNLVYMTGILLFIPPPRQICLLGTGGGGLVHFFRRHYPDSRITAVELDGELLDIMQQRMALPEEDQLLSYRVDDAAAYLENCRQNFDLILIDIFIGDRCPPWLLKPEFIRLVYARLNRHGGAAFNLLINSEREFTQYYRNLRQVFDRQTLCLRVEDLDNIVTFAIREPSAVRDMHENMEIAITLGDIHEQNYLEVLSAIYSANPSGSGVI